jgi:hypothetical protein
MAAENADMPIKKPLQVFVRIRPLLQMEAGEKVMWQATNKSTLACLDHEATSVNSMGGSKGSGKASFLNSGSSTYLYNRVFPDSSSTDEVYLEAAHPIVLSAMNGYNGTVFTYGQTASG